MVGFVAWTFGFGTVARGMNAKNIDPIDQR